MMLGPMPFALALVLLGNAGTPLQPQQFQAHLSPREGVLAPSLGSRGYEIYRGVKNTVAGGILTGLGTAFGVLGIYGLIGAANETGSTKTVFTVLGWTSAGFGMLLGAVGIPLLIVGIVQLSMPPAVAKHVTVSEQGLLAVRF